MGPGQPCRHLEFFGARHEHQGQFGLIHAKQPQDIKVHTPRAQDGSQPQKRPQLSFAHTPPRIVPTTENSRAKQIVP